MSRLICVTCMPPVPPSQDSVRSGGHPSRPRENWRLPLRPGRSRGSVPSSRSVRAAVPHSHRELTGLIRRGRIEAYHNQTDRSAYVNHSTTRCHPRPVSHCGAGSKVSRDMIASAEAHHGCDAVDQIRGCILSKTLQRNRSFHLTDCAAEISFSCYLRAYREMLPNSGTGFLVLCHMHTCTHMCIRRYT